MEEVFDFVHCVDSDRRMLWNIESKVDARHTNRTADVLEFVQRQHEVFELSGYKHAITVCRPYISRERVRSKVSNIQYQSFDWRTLKAMKVGDLLLRNEGIVPDFMKKEYDPSLTLSALIDE